jgi:hypothetical protein
MRERESEELKKLYLKKHTVNKKKTNYALEER